MFMSDLYSRRDMYLYTTYENTTICCDAIADPDRRSDAGRADAVGGR